MLRTPLLWASRSPRMRKIVESSSLAKPVVQRFIPAQNDTDLVPTIQDALGRKLQVTLDYLGEDTLDRQQAQGTVDAYMGLFERIKPLNAGGDVEVSVKLSAVGQALAGDGHKIALDNAYTICVGAETVGTTVTLDMEDHTTTDSTLEIARELRKEFPWLGIVLQSYLRRTEADCREFSGPQSRVRLCKGAYQEPASVAYQSREEVDASYLRCASTLLAGQGYPMLATHDPKMIEGAQSLAAEHRRALDSWEFQMLYGIRTQEQERLAAQGHGMRIYMAYGDEWYGYFMRRLAERPANLGFFLRSLVSTK